MDSSHQINVPLRSGGKKIRKRRELDALIAHSFGKKQLIRRTTLNRLSQDKLLSVSTDDAEDYTCVQMNRPKNNCSTNRCHNRKYMLCKPLLLFMASMLLIGLFYWMYLDLRREIYDYRQKIEEVAVMNQDLPDTLQNWHEISTLLEKNQTATTIRLNELERTMEMLRINFTKYRASADVQQNYAKEQKLVADFGAKIESVVTDMESIKDHYANVLNKQTKMQTDLNDLNGKVMDAQEKVVHVGEILSNFSKEEVFIKSYLRNDSVRLLDLMDGLNLTFTQKWNALHKNIESNKLQLIELLSSVTNVTKHFASMENNWEDYKTKIKDYQGLMHRIENDVSNLKLKSRTIDQSIADMHTRCNNSNETLTNPRKISNDEYNQKNTTTSQERKEVIQIH
ncbi:calcium-binding and coiled-coil domain-containing protein 1 [Anastrepha ludens]|uniref:calcium-binding and coiled-coil domain-containing protein 1 n=1 Tax=Anastrepha ludens TaxID=28586 RepID=UPI0023B06D62|nr:calcium-binding and coiled-coil domain-containing protein 1 [Anastrepha ludens]